MPRTETTESSFAVAHLVEKVPGVCSGRAVIAGTRIPVYEVVELTRAGLSTSDLLDRFISGLTKDHILAALTYAVRNSEEMEREVEESARLHATPGDLEPHTARRRGKKAASRSSLPRSSRR